MFARPLTSQLKDKGLEKKNNNCRYKRLSYRIGTEPVCVQIHLWITDLTEQGESLIVL